MLRALFLIFSLLFVSPSGFAAVDALDEVNQFRARRGLRPFARDNALSQAAAATADYRAAHRIEGHVNQGGRTDYSFLPRGAQAKATGCAAMTPDWGWHSCCDDEAWNYAGAAYTYGSDGQRYMHLFVSNTPNAEPAPQITWEKIGHGSWYKRDGKYVGFLHNNRQFQWRKEDGTYSDPQKLEPGQQPKLQK